MELPYTPFVVEMENFFNGLLKIIKGFLALLGM